MTVDHLTAKPPVIAYLKELISGLNEQFRKCGVFRTITLVNLNSEVYLDYFQGGNSTHPDTAIRAHILRPDLREEWMERLLKCINFFKLRGHD